jgi:outer membrane biosynthesis protein TonB
MRQLAAFALALALGAAAAVALASCGGGEDAKLLPGTTAQQISENLDTVQQFAAEGECVGAADAAQEVSDEVEALTGVDPKLKEALQRGATKLSEVVTTCEEETTETVAPAEEAPSTEETTKLPPGQEKKEEKELEKETEKAEKEAEKEATSEPPTTPTETTPGETTTTPTEGGGTGAPGGVSPGTPVGPGGE